MEVISGPSFSECNGDSQMTVELFGTMFSNHMQEGAGPVKVELEFPDYSAKDRRQ